MKRVLAILAVLFAAVAVLSWAGAYLSTPSPDRAAAFTVAQGEGVEAIVHDLKAQGVIRSELFFKDALRRSGLATKLQPGTYDLRSADTFGEIIKRLSSGGVPANEFVLLIKEGWNLSDVRDALGKAGYAKADALYDVTGKPAAASKQSDLVADYGFLKDKPATVSLEGFLFPDTYRVFRDATPEDIVRKLLDNFDKKLDADLRAKIAASGRSTFDTVTLASIVEDEVRSDDDRRKVADIFWRRLAKGMALQADSTVNYATGKSLASVSYEDTLTDSRYNTYKYPGLPPGPICNPGLSAIRAAADPEPNDAWYFLTDEDGNVHYARTLDEQNRNKAKYLR